MNLANDLSNNRHASQMDKDNMCTIAKSCLSIKIMQ